MDETRILEQLFDRKIIRILKVFFRESEKDLYLQEISGKATVPMATTSRILARLSRLELIQVKTISRFKIYHLSENKHVVFLSRLFKEDLRIMKLFVEKASKIDGVRNIILHGKETKDRANVLLIGENIDPGEVKSICAEIKEQHRFIISPLSLTPEQYNQMSSMGLYSGTKKILYEREAK